MGVMSPAPCGTSATGTTMIGPMTIYKGERQRKCGLGSMSSHHGHGPSGASTRGSQVDKRACQEERAEKTLSVRIESSFAQNEADEKKKEVATKENLTTGSEFRSKSGGVTRFEGKCALESARNPRRTGGRDTASFSLFTLVSTMSRQFHTQIDGLDFLGMP